MCYVCGSFNLYALSILHIFNFKKVVPMRGLEILSLCFFWVWNLSLMTLVPGGVWTKISFLLLSHAACGIIHMQITLSHFAMPSHSGATVFTQPDEKGRVDPAWFIKMQLHTSLDVDCYRWLDWFHGGLQFQVAHHIFPRIPRHQLRHLREKHLLPLCEKHGLTYHSLSFLDCLIYTLKHLREQAVKARDLPASKLYKSMLFQMLGLDG
ncbi:MAG: hypothetical protein MHM6MM_009251 [Cercozoa sp. M6MM]